MTVGEKIREIRLAKEMTQVDLAEKLGVTQSMIGQYERSKKPPKFDTILKIAEALEVEPGELISQKIVVEALRNDVLPKLKETAQKMAERYDTDDFETLEMIAKIEANIREMNKEGIEKAKDLMDLLTRIPEFKKES